MKIKTTAKKIIKKVENSTSGLPQKILIMEALIEVEKDGVSQMFRLREFNDEAKKTHIKIMKSVTRNQKYDQKTQENLDNRGRKFTISDLTVDEYRELNALANEVIDHFK